MRIRLDIAYDGTHFRGWAVQPVLRTVQGTLESALSLVLGGEPRLVVAGRTDAGVHATGQVAHIDLDEDQQRRLRNVRGRGVKNATDAETLTDYAVGALAARLTGAGGAYPDVVVRRTSLAPEGFDARFSAVWRRYEYRIADRVAGYNPMERLRTTSVRSSLDVEKMDAAASSLIGLHDWAAYCRPKERATTIRTLLEFDWHRDEHGILVANVKADAFCHSMVRALVGACAAVGDGRLDVEDVAEIRDELQRVPETKVLAARGLTLTAVGYPNDELLALRAEQTRRRRSDEQ
ncbi:tRNA pseudouridine(38-40) synthase TruA [Microbacterium sp. NPDC076911]|uniref:tRNA pseudouridine(38-40) synthase TruA n=1 Tax=Microbacterium sp. NPDC076911 TaxID=3154958 RepID=UPI0034165422